MSRSREHAAIPAFSMEEDDIALFHTLCVELEAEPLAQLSDDPLVAERIVGLLHPVYESAS